MFCGILCSVMSQEFCGYWWEGGEAVRGWAGIGRRGEQRLILLTFVLGSYIIFPLEKETKEFYEYV